MNGFGRGLPSSLQKAPVAQTGVGGNFAAASSAATFDTGAAARVSGNASPGYHRPTYGPLGGVVASARQRQVESDPDRGMYQDWARLDPSRSEQKPQYVPGLNQRPVEREEKKAPTYIPGLDANPALNNDNNNNDNSEAVEKPRLPDAALIRDFRAGNKNPISALTEYCTALHLIISFKEVAPPKRGAGIALKFANECSINGKAIAVGTGGTKKEAKTAAARSSFVALLGLTEDDLEDGDGEGKQLVDSFGRKVNLKSADNQWKQSRRGANDAMARPLRPDEILPRLNLEDESVERDLRHRTNQIHPVEALTTWSVNKSTPLVFEVTKSQDGGGGFRALVKIRGKVHGEGFGDTSNLAKRDAATNALMQLDPAYLPHILSQQLLQPQGGPCMEKIEDALSATFQAKHQDLIFEIMKAAKDRLDIDVDSLTECPAAGFVLHRGPGLDAVVAVGIGTDVAQVLPEKDGRTLIDLHAFALARRGLVKYLQSEVRSYYNGELTRSIFDMNQDGMLRMKPGHHVSLFMTHSPSGDADVFARANRVNDLHENSIGLREQDGNSYHRPCREDFSHGQLRFKTEQGLTYTWDTPNQHKNEYPMSCSDKILRCNVLGVQGALLSRVLVPIYIDRIVWGSKFDHGVCVRAVCCRIDSDFTADQHNGFRTHHPRVGRVTEYVVDPEEDRVRHFPIAANWSLDADPTADEKKKLVEILDPATGKAFTWSPFRTIPDPARPAPSRLCKAASFFRFKALVREPLTSEVADSTYLMAKQTAAPYENMKRNFKENLKANKWGEWVRKPKERLEGFFK